MQHNDKHQPCCTRVENLGVKLGSKQILRNVNLHMHCGDITVIIGPNGAGKTTLLRALTGEIKHTGNITFAPAMDTTNRRQPRFGYVPQRMATDRSNPMTVIDLFSCTRSKLPVWLGHSTKAEEEALNALKRVKADHLANNRIGQLSCGQLQRVLLALALTPIPEILLLDEPLAGMDHAGTSLFYEIVSTLRKEIDLAVLMISHDLVAAASIANHIIFLNQEVICEGPPDEVFQYPAVRDVFGIGMRSPETDFATSSTLSKAGSS